MLPLPPSPLQPEGAYQSLSPFLPSFSHSSHPPQPWGNPRGPLGGRGKSRVPAFSSGLSTSKTPKLHEVFNDEQMVTGGGGGGRAESERTQGLWSSPAALPVRKLRQGAPLHAPVPGAGKPVPSSEDPRSGHSARLNFQNPQTQPWLRRGALGPGPPPGVLPAPTLTLGVLPGGVGNHAPKGVPEILDPQCVRGGELRKDRRTTAEPLSPVTPCNLPQLRQTQSRWGGGGGAYSAAVRGGGLRESAWGGAAAGGPNPQRLTRQGRGR
ncbi:hypothetical protein H8959_017646 [Pygathrix nigripes]